jgi:septal ring factor EnvC (AmiA/AmiB activator)
MRTVLSLLLALLLTGTPGLAQTRAPTPPPAPADANATERLSKKLELEAVEKDLRTGAEARARMQADVDRLKQDRARLADRLIEVTGRVQAGETRIRAIEERMTVLGQTETAIRRSLDGRRGLLGEVLASLQRMGRRPPPALLVKPDDMLEAVRSSILLGAVLPELKSETEALAADLGELIRLRTLASGEREALTRDLSSLVKDRAELAALVEARRQDAARLEKSFTDEQQKATALAGKAQSLRDLLARFESDEQNRARAEASELMANDPRAKEVRDRIAALTGRDPAKIALKAPFQDLKGSLPLPASGTMVRGFNVPDVAGTPTRGISLATRAGAIVSAPAEGWISYAGPFRTYGQLLIVNAGNGYYILLAGMERINVSVGQFVVAGEPVAQMGEGARAVAASTGTDGSQPILYVEFRKDGTSIDPSPWWASSTNEKVRG